MSKVHDVTYRVWFHIERLCRSEGTRERIERPMELACFHTREEARSFCSEMQNRYSATCTGEQDLLDDQVVDQFVAGD